MSEQRESPDSSVPHRAGDTLQKANRSLTRQLWVFAGGFFAFGFALIPLYNVLCDITGYGDRTQLAQASAFTPGAQTDRRVTVEFMSAAPTFGDWDFHPEVAQMEIQPGQLYAATFYAKNLRGQPVTAQAIPNIAPSQATQYFHKTECFCFTPQAFAANQTRELIVRFSVDPKLPANIDRLTLAYSMYDAPPQAMQTVVPSPGG
jgi:cytochrome c oxidase assembly protein subunit 11